MKKRSLAILVLVCLTMFGTACQSKIEPQENRTVLSQMEEHSIEYVGDNSGVSKLLSFLPQFNKTYIQNMFSLQTDREPYAIVIYYEPTEGEISTNMRITDEMNTYAGYLFSCIDNLGYVEYAYRMTPSEGNLEQDKYEVLLKIERP